MYEEHDGTVRNWEIKSEEVEDGVRDEQGVLYIKSYTSRRIQDARVKAILADDREVLDAGSMWEWMWESRRYCLEEKRSRPVC